MYVIGIDLECVVVFVLCEVVLGGVMCGEEGLCVV